MNERQRRFAESYAACGNAAQAAREAGYSERTARSQGQRLLTDADIMEYIKRLQDQSASVRIATLNQAKAFWSDIFRDPEQKTADRLKASELLARSAGAFVHVRQDDGGAGFVAGAGNELDDDVLIVLPFNGRDAELQKPVAPTTLGFDFGRDEDAS